MAKNFLDYDGLLYFWGKLKTKFAEYTKTEDLNIPTPSSSTPQMDGAGSTGASTSYARADHVHPSDSSKAPTNHASAQDTYGKATNGNYGHVILSDSTDGTAAAVSGGTAATPKAVAEALAAAKAYTDQSAGTGNQDAFSFIKVGNDTVAAEQETDTFELYAGSNVTLTADTTNDKVTIAATDTTYSAVGSTGDPGLMTSADKAKLDNIIVDANGKIDPDSLPSYVDDVIEAYPRSGQTELSATWLSKTNGGEPLTPEGGIIYILMADSTTYATNTQFRWATNTYVKLNDGGVSSISNGEIDTIVAS